MQIPRVSPPQKHKYTPWTSEDCEAIGTEYRDGGVVAFNKWCIQAGRPERKSQSIRQKAHELGVKCNVPPSSWFTSTRNPRINRQPPSIRTAKISVTAAKKKLGPVRHRICENIDSEIMANVELAKMGLWKG